MIDAEGLRRMKGDAVVFLQSALPSYEEQFAGVLSTDERLGIYVHEVVDNPDRHNLYEILGVKRWFSLLSKYQWNRKKAKRYIKFYELLKFSGLEGRRSYRMTPVQVYIFATIYGLRRADGRRLIRLAYLFVPRKFSKTTSVASMAVYDMLFGDNNAQAYVASNSYDQSKICFDEIRAIMNDLDPNASHLKINREKITFRDRLRDSLIHCLSANPRSKDGFNASLVIVDEYAQARNTAGRSGAELKNVLTSSMGARPEPLTMVITTASDVLDGPFAHELEGVKAVLRGEMENDTMFAVLFMPDVDDEIGDPATWRKVQPHLGITVQADYYEHAWADAQLSAENMLTFKTKLLNIFAVSETASWISADLARKVSVPFDPAALKGRPAAMCALDLSESDDFSAVSVGVYIDKNFYFHTKYFFPEGSLSGHPNEALYRVWIEQGHMQLIRGDVIDYRAIVDYILELNKSVSILRIGYDPWKSQEVINMLAAAGAKNILTPVKQTYGYFTAPVESFEHGVRTGRVFINDNPINAFCFGNAILDEDNLENKKPLKRSQNMKIDGVITMLMCQRMFIDYER